MCPASYRAGNTVNFHKTKTMTWCDSVLPKRRRQVRLVRYSNLRALSGVLSFRRLS